MYCSICADEINLDTEHCILNNNEHLNHKCICGTSHIKCLQKWIIIKLNNNNALELDNSNNVMLLDRIEDILKCEVCKKSYPLQVQKSVYMYLINKENNKFLFRTNYRYVVINRYNLQKMLIQCIVKFCMLYLSNIVIIYGLNRMIGIYIDYRMILPNILANNLIISTLNIGFLFGYFCGNVYWLFGRQISNLYQFTRNQLISTFHR